MKAKYPGTCRICSHPFSAGEEIEWSKDEGATHAWCAERARQDAPAAPSALLDQVLARQAAEWQARGCPGPEPDPDESDLHLCPTHGKSLGLFCPVCAAMANSRTLDRPGPRV